MLKHKEKREKIGDRAVTAPMPDRTEFIEVNHVGPSQPN